MRCSFFCNPAQADNNAIPDPAIVSELGIAANNDSAKMVNDEIAPDIHFARQLDAGDNLNELEHDLVDKREEFSQNRWPHLIAPSPKAIDEHDPEPLGAPISFVGSQIVADVFKHRCLNALLATPVASPTGR